MDTSVNATFDAAGRAVVRIGPTRSGERWHVILTNISTTSLATTAFRLYRGREAASALLDQSLFNGNGDVSDTVYELLAGQDVVGVWSGGTVGAIGTLTLNGERIS